MKRLLLSLLFIATGVMAQSMPGPNPPPGSNDIYIDQVGNGANINGTTADQVMRELQKCHWFKWGDQ